MENLLKYALLPIWPLECGRQKRAYLNAVFYFSAVFFRLGRKRGKNPIGIPTFYQFLRRRNLEGPTPMFGPRGHGCPPLKCKEDG